MAFVASTISVLKHHPYAASSSSLRLLNRPTYYRTSTLNFSAAKWRMVSSPDPASTSSTQQTSSSDAPPSIDSAVDVDKLVSRAKDVAADVTDRPGYYSKIAGYLVGGVVVLTIIRAVVKAIDSLPVLPSSLELIGLGYTTWFIWRYVLFRESRAELLEEIDDFLGRTRPGGKKDQ